MQWITHKYTRWDRALGRHGSKGQGCVKLLSVRRIRGDRAEYDGSVKEDIDNPFQHIPSHPYLIFPWQHTHTSSRPLGCSMAPERQFALQPPHPNPIGRPITSSRRGLFSALHDFKTKGPSTYSNPRIFFDQRSKYSCNLSDDIGV